MTVNPYCLLVAESDKGPFINDITHIGRGLLTGRPYQRGDERGTVPGRKINKNRDLHDLKVPNILIF